jgi:hypothetical protein
MSNEVGPSILVKRAFFYSAVGFGIITLVMILLTPRLVQLFYPLPEDTGASYYGWQTEQAGIWVRVSYWLGYVLHQLAVWWLFFKGRRVEPALGRVSKWHLAMIGVNLGFVALHLLQTQLWYDGLARDVPIWTSQGSVIVMLVLVLYIMIPKRGLFWGRRFNPPQNMLNLIKKWHGLFISWALVFTFWFHPMDGNWGLVSGFIYMFLLFIQMNLFNTTLHTNRLWIVLLEVFVAVHGTLITVYKDNPIWTMFLYGFLWMFVLTQLHTLELPSWLRWGTLLVFLASMALVYGYIRGFNHIYEVTFIPVALYGGVGGLLVIGWIWDRISPPKQSPGEASQIHQPGST